MSRTKSNKVLVTDSSEKHEELGQNSYVNTDQSRRGVAVIFNKPIELYIDINIPDTDY